MRLGLFLAVLPALANAQALVSVLDAPGLSDAAVHRVQRLGEVVLKDVSSLAVGESPAFKRGAPRKCGEDCARDVVHGLAAPVVLLMELHGEPKSDHVSADVSLWLDGARTAARRVEGGLDSLEPGLRAAAESLLPQWAKKGFGGLRLDVERGAIVKIDGRPAPSTEAGTLSVPAGAHHLDVVFPDGHAVLQRLDVAEGSRRHVEVPVAALALDGRARPVGVSALRTASYAVWMTGAAALAGGFIAGAVSRSTSAGLTPCRADSRDCLTLDVALERSRQAESAATTGNVLLGVGTGLAVVGAGLFVVDVVGQ